ncbi:MAG: TetR/AcrR family transcriptional regulator [Janthinobacterium lividum]
MSAALKCYADHGWSGFHFEAVATEAGVGRPALYRRWKDRSALLIDAFREYSQPLLEADLGSLRAELVAIAVSYSQTMQGSRALAGQRLFIEQRALPAVFEVVKEEISDARYALIERAVQRAVTRGEAGAHTPVKLLENLLLGSTLTWSLFAPGSVRALRTLRETEELVEAVLHGTVRPD